jgi:hypothetical protein
MPGIIPKKMTNRAITNSLRAETNTLRCHFLESTTYLRDPTPDRCPPSLQVLGPRRTGERSRPCSGSAPGCCTSRCCCSRAGTSVLAAASWRRTCTSGSRTSATSRTSLRRSGGFAPLYLAVAALGPVGGQTRVHLVYPQVDDGGPARDDRALQVEEAVREDRDRLHAELEALVEVLAVEHPAEYVPRQNSRDSLSVTSGQLTRCCI